jgi:hypothetical protein
VRRNWSAWGGFLLGLGGVVGYFALILTHNPTLHRWLELPVVNLAVVAAGVGLSLVAVRRAFQGTHGGRLLAPLLAALNVGLAGLFGWYLFSYSYRMPASARAPAVGAVAPDFALPDEHGNAVRLSAARGHPVVLVFYRGFW